MKLCLLLSLALASLATAQNADSNAVLIKQRDELNAAHMAQLTQVSADFKARLAEADAKIAAAEQRAADAEAALATTKATLEKTISDTKAAIEAAKAAEEKTGRGPRWETLVKGQALIAPILTEATKDEIQKQREALAAAIAAKQAELARLKP